MHCNAARVALSACGIFLLSVAQAADAPDSSQPSAGIEEVIVTAQKRNENQQDVPIAITTVTAEMIDRFNIKDMTDLAGKAPNTQFTDAGVVPGGFIPTIRGLGERSADQNSDQPVLVVVDGVAFGGILGGFLDSFDLDAVEVLRGPQGTLQGRNATGGVLNIRTRAPSMTDREIRTNLDYGRYNTWTARFAIDGPVVTDKFAAKFALVSTNSDGAYRNDFTGNRTGGRKYAMGRLNTLYTPTDAFTLAVNATYIKDQSDQPLGRQVNTDQAFPRTETGAQGVSLICAMFGVCTPAPAGHNSSNYNTPNWTDQGVITANANYDAGPFTLTSVTGYRKVKDSTNLDLDFTQIEFIQVLDQIHVNNTWSQEFRIASSDGGGWDANGRLKWVGGVYYFNTTYHQSTEVCLPLIGVPCNSPRQLRGQNTDSYAAFVHADYSITEQWQIFGGARETKDKKQFHEEVPVLFAETGSWKKFTGEAGVRFKFADRQMVYARFNQGYRAGGINPLGTTYQPEKVNATEVGAKLSDSSNRLVVNAALFQYKYDNIQRGVVFPKDTPPFYDQGTANAAKATIKGAELEVTALPVPELLLGVQGGYLDASYDRFIDNVVGAGGVLTAVDNSALRIPNTPKWTFGTNADYTIRIGGGPLSDVTLHGDYSYRTKFNVTPGDIPVGNQPGYGLLNASVRFNSRSDRFSASIYGKNLTDKYYITLADNVGGLNLYAIQGFPRTYGVDFSAKFGF